MLKRSFMISEKIVVSLRHTSLNYRACETKLEGRHPPGVISAIIHTSSLDVKTHSDVYFSFGCIYTHSDVQTGCKIFTF